MAWIVYNKGKGNCIVLCEYEGAVIKTWEFIGSGSRASCEKTVVGLNANTLSPAAVIRAQINKQASWYKKILADKPVRRAPGLPEKDVLVKYGIAESELAELKALEERHTERIRAAVAARNAQAPANAPAPSQWEPPRWIQMGNSLISWEKWMSE